MEKRTYEINGRGYQLLVPPPRIAMGLCTRVAVLLGPVLGSLGKDIKAGGWSVFSKALQSVDPVKADALMMDAVKAAKLHCSGHPISDDADFDRHFDSHRGDLYQVMAWSLWESVRDFFPQLGAFAQIIQKAKEHMPEMEAKANTSPSQPDGPPIGG